MHATEKYGDNTITHIPYNDRSYGTATGKGKIKILMLECIPYLVASLSPAHCSKYYDGKLTDGKAMIRLASLDKEQRQIGGFLHKGLPVTLGGCQVQLDQTKKS